MDCRRMEQLLSPYLDGELSPVETEAVSSHLSTCACCAQEYRAMAQISAACQDMGNVQMAAPAGFKAALMQRINEEAKVAVPRQSWNWLRPSWKQAAAGAAAALMLALGALSMNTGPIMQIAENFPAIYQPDHNVPTVSNPIINEPAAPTGNGIPAGTQNSPTNPTVAVAPTVDGAPAARVFLNKERYMTTTLLQVKVVDSQAALEQALKLAAAAQAQTLILGQQVNENGSYTAVKITVPPSLSAELITGLAKLGKVSNQEVDKKDITTRYADTLSQYQALVTQRATLQDVGQKAILDQRIGDLAAELQDWEQQAEQETIVLRLE